MRSAHALACLAALLAAAAAAAQPASPVQAPAAAAQPASPVQAPAAGAQPASPVQAPAAGAQSPSPVQAPVAGAQPPSPVQAPTAAAQTRQAPAPARVYGIEVETRGDTQRLLVFADGPLSPVLEELDADRVRLSLPRAALDPSAPTRVRPDRGGAIVLATARERRGKEAPEVEIEVRRARGAQPELEQKGSALALSFQGGAPPATLSLSFENADLKQVVERIARSLGERFIYDEKLQGRVSIASTQPVTTGEARAILDTVLLLEGFAAVPTPSGALRIMPIQQGKAAAPFRLNPDDEASEAVVTTFLRLQAADATSLVSLLQPWLGQQALAVAQPETNGLILAANEHRLHQLLGVVRLLDQAAGEELLVRRLRHRGADEVGELLEGAIGENPLPNREAQVWSDARTNTLVVKAGPERLAELRDWIQRIDTPPPARGVLHVQPVRFADPEELAKLLRDVAAGSRPVPGVLPPGAVAVPQLRADAFTVVADRPSHSLVIQADPETFRVIEHLLDNLDVPPQRIDVEAMVLEVSTARSLSLGFDALVPMSNPKAPDDWIAVALLDPTGSGLLQPGAGSPGAFAARVDRKPLIIPIVDSSGNPQNLVIPRGSGVLLADQRNVQGRVLSRPHLQVVSGEENEISVGDNIPVPQAATSAAGTSGAIQNRVSIARQDVGVRMRVRPTLGQGGYVRLELEVEATRVASSLAGDVERVGPTIQKRSLTSTLYVVDDEVAVVGLGKFPEYTSMEVGTPWLKDIPLLGFFFRATQEQQMDTNLLITVQARVHESEADVVAESVRRRLALERILSREKGLAPADGPYALRVATRERAGDAEAIAADLTRRGERTRVLPWEWEGVQRWDVYLVGIETPGQIGEASLRAHDDGWHPELVVVDEPRSS